MVNSRLADTIQLVVFPQHSPDFRVVQEQRGCHTKTDHNHHDYYYHYHYDADHHHDFNVNQHDHRTAPACCLWSLFRQRPNST